jgi:hydrogenase expression/formation protein HypC
MCLAIPVNIVALDDDGCNATVDAGGVQQKVNCAFIEHPQPGDYVLVHAGFAIRKWSARDVEEYNRIVDHGGDDAK